NTLMKAFNQAKEIAYKRILNPRNVALAWVRNALEEQIAVLGPDPWEFGLTPKNRSNLATLQRYCAQQGIVRKERPLEELFIDAGKVSIPEEIQGLYSLSGHSTGWKGPLSSRSDNICSHRGLPSLKRPRPFCDSRVLGF